MRFLDGFLIFNCVLVLVSVCGYYLHPAGTITHFGGTPTPSAIVWVRIVASGDLLLAFLMWNAYKAPPAVQALTVKSMGFYTTFHCGGFLWGHYFVEPQPTSSVAMNMQGFLIAFLLVWYYLYYRPLTSSSATTTGNSETVAPDTASASRLTEREDSDGAVSNKKKRS